MAHVSEMHGQKKNIDTVLAIAETLIVLVDVGYSAVVVLMSVGVEIPGIDTSKIKIIKTQWNGAWNNAFRREANLQRTETTL